MKALRKVAAIVGLSALILHSLEPAAATEFFAGKTIDFVIGGDAGGGYDLYARAIGQVLGKHLPGKPILVPRDMPGAGSANAASALFHTLPRDGTAIGALTPGAVIRPLLDSRLKNLFEPAKFNYLGSADSGARVCITWGASKIKTYQDALQQTTIMGASAPGASTTDYAHMHIRATGAKFNIITGYVGTVDIFLAMERGEVDGMCGIDWSSLQTERPDWLRDKKINILVQDGLKPDPLLTEMKVPFVRDFIVNKTDIASVDLILTPQVFARPYVAPPGTPADRISVLRDGFAATFKDSAFLAQAKRQRLEIEPVFGEDLQAVVSKLYQTSSLAVTRAQELLAP